MSGPERSTETFERSGPERPDGFFERSGFAGAAWDGDACAVASKDRGETTCACGDVDEPGDYAALSNEEIYADYVERFFADPLDPDLAKQNALILVTLGVLTGIALILGLVGYGLDRRDAENRAVRAPASRPSPFDVSRAGRVPGRLVRPRRLRPGVSPRSDARRSVGASPRASPTVYRARRSRPRGARATASTASTRPSTRRGRRTYQEARRPRPTSSSSSARRRRRRRPNPSEAARRPPRTPRRFARRPRRPSRPRRRTGPWCPRRRRRAARPRRPAARAPAGRSVRGDPRRASTASSSAWRYGETRAGRPRGACQTTSKPRRTRCRRSSSINS